MDASDGLLENFGWPCVEGLETTGYAGLSLCSQFLAQPNARTQPVFQYQHGQPIGTGDPCTVANSQISGLAFYETGSYPTSYQGALFFADYARNCVAVMLKGVSGLPDPATRSTVLSTAAGPVDLTIGPGGDVFYASLDTGTIRRIQYERVNLAPAAVALATPTSGGPPLTVTFSAAASSDPAGDTLAYAWDLDNDGAFDDGTAVQAVFSYTTPGAHTARLRVTDAGGLSDVVAVVVTAHNTAPVASIVTPTAASTWAVGETISFSGGATDPEEGVLAPSALSWSVILHDCPSTCTQQTVQSFPGVASGSFTAPDHRFPSHLEIRLTATDAGGLQSTTSVLINPRTATLTFQSVPAGLSLVVGGVSSTPPFTRTVIVSSRNTVAATTPQVVGGTAYQFQSWSDAGAQTHDITPASSTTYTATYAAPAPSGLVAAYAFNEASGTSVVDTSGNNLTGTITGATRVPGGKFGGGLSFNGTSNLVTVNSAAPLNLTTGMTLEAWVNPTTLGTAWRNVLIKERTNGEIYNLYANTDTAGPVIYTALASAPNSPTSTSTGVRLTANTWAHLAATYDGAALRLYVNGTQVATRAQSGGLVTSTGALRIGGNSIWGEYFAGLIDDVRIYNRALTAAEIQTDMITPVGSAPTDTTPPVRSNGQPSSALPAGTTQTTLSVTTNETATCRYSTTAGLAYAAMTNTFSVTNGTSHSTPVTGLTNGGSYTFYVRCQDAAANANPDDVAIAFSVSQPGGDTVPPVVALTAPADSSSLTGTVQVTANATDNVGVVGVQFLLDGANLGSEDTTAPYAYTWNTTTATAGPHTLAARARDAAGNTTTSTLINVAVGSGPLPGNFYDEVVIGTGVTFPTAFEFLLDGRMLISEFTGKILVVQAGSTAVDPTPVLQLTNVISEEVTAGGERGLVNVIADPSFVTNGYIYIFYTANSPRRDRVSRLTMVGNTASLTSEFVIWQGVEDSTSDSHHGGGLGFGPDGKLYITTGDNAAPSTVPSLTSDHGKILRYNLDGTIPTDNPFHDGTGPNIDAIWARGLRNPYRFSFDPPTGRMYIGDVGFNSIEELNLGEAGANYGWPTCEGPCGTAGMTNPIFSYNHDGHDASITGGFVYRASQFPAAYHGVYFFADFARNFIRYLTLNAAGAVTSENFFLPADGSLDSAFDPVMLKPGPDGSLYYVDFGWGWLSTTNTAAIRRVRYVSGNQPPIAVAAATPQNGLAPLSVSFSRAGSSDPENQPLSYLWTFGDGTQSTQPDPVHVYAQSGTYAARVAVSDGTNTDTIAGVDYQRGKPADGGDHVSSQWADVRRGRCDCLQRDRQRSRGWYAARVGVFVDRLVPSRQPRAPGPGSLDWCHVGSIHDTERRPRFLGNNKLRVHPHRNRFDGAAAFELCDRDSEEGQPDVYDESGRLEHLGRRDTEADALREGHADGVPAHHRRAEPDRGAAQPHVQCLVRRRRAESRDSRAGGRPDLHGHVPVCAVAGALGLVAAYAFNEASGTSVVDTSGNNLTGTITGATRVPGGKFGGGLSFNGTSNLVTVNSAAPLNLTTGMTLEAWVNPTTLGTAWRNVLIKERTNGEIYNLYANTDTAGPVIYTALASAPNSPTSHVHGRATHGQHVGAPGGDV